MKKIHKTSLVILGILLFSVAILFGIQSLNEKEEGQITGEVVLTKDILPSFSEAVVIDVIDSIDEYTNYYRTFEVNASAEIYVNIVSDKPLNYVLLPQSEVDNYLKGRSFQPKDISKNILSVEKGYPLNSGNYSIVLTTSNEPVKVNLLLKTREL